MESNHILYIQHSSNLNIINCLIINYKMILFLMDMKLGVTCIRNFYMPKIITFFFQNFKLRNVLNRNDRKRNCGFLRFCFINHLRKIPIDQSDFMSKNP